jgi:hypothetical protein
MVGHNNVLRTTFEKNGGPAGSDAAGRTHHTYDHDQTGHVDYVGYIGLNATVGYQLKTFCNSTTIDATSQFTNAQPLGGGINWGHGGNHLFDGTYTQDLTPADHKIMSILTDGAPATGIPTVLTIGPNAKFNLSADTSFDFTIKFGKTFDASGINLQDPNAKLVIMAPAVLPANVKVTGIKPENIVHA